MQVNSVCTICAVIAESKLENLKAIHNTPTRITDEEIAVIAESKLENLKAIHNSSALLLLALQAVIAESKLEYLKAIYNIREYTREAGVDADKTQTF